LENTATGFAHGRVNLVGEHTDYNGGLSLPTVIPQGTTVQLARIAGELHQISSVNLGGDIIECPVGMPLTGRHEFQDYFLACIAQFEREVHCSVGALRIDVSSTVPMGCGVSSSAALEIALLRALDSLVGASTEAALMARLAQAAEHAVGVRCGILDQTAIAHGEAGKIMLIDFQGEPGTIAGSATLPPGSGIIVIDTGLPRTLAGSAYNQRVAECAQACATLGVHTLSDSGVAERLSELNEIYRRRARHIVTENARVRAALLVTTPEQFGALMTASHHSLRRDYEVTTNRLDRAVDILHRTDGVYGARMTGAGFGGAVVALGDEARLREVAEQAVNAMIAEGFTARLLVP
jgi:galactokinase